MGVPGWGDHTCLGGIGVGWGLVFGKDWPWILGWAKNTISLGFPERFPTFMGLRKPKEERMGPPDVAKVGLQGKPTGILLDRFFPLHTGGPRGLYKS
mgnify:CR=1 FL=1